MEESSIKKVMEHFEKCDLVNMDSSYLNGSGLDYTLKSGFWDGNNYYYEKSQDLANMFKNANSSLYNAWLRVYETQLDFIKNFLESTHNISNYVSNFSKNVITNEQDLLSTLESITKKSQEISNVLNQLN